MQTKIVHLLPFLISGIFLCPDFLVFWEQARDKPVEALLNADPDLFEPRILRHVAPSSHSQCKPLW